MGRPRPVREVMELLGSNPLICMPIDASNPEKNYGTGGDFTLNGGGLQGSRGMSEYITRSARFLNGGNNLSLSLVSPPIDNKCTMVFATKPLSGSPYSLNIGNNLIRVYYGTSFGILVDFGSALATGYMEPKPVIGEFCVLLLSYNGDTQTLNAYINGVQATVSPTTTSDNVDMTGLQAVLGGVAGNDTDSYSCISYFTTDYIDFSQEENRNLFVNQLGYPRDLKPLIEEGTIPEPLIYLPFDEPDNLGKNLGTGGDFTINGVITQGEDFNL